MRPVLLSLLTISLLGTGLTGCQRLDQARSSLRLPGVYRIDIPQGTPLTREQVMQVQAGMTRDQVRFILGTPAMVDTLHPDRWIYLYRYVPGTYARKAGLTTVDNQQLVIHFNEAGQVSRLDQLASIPAEQPGLPASRDPVLRADPL